MDNLSNVPAVQPPPPPIDPNVLAIEKQIPFIQKLPTILQFNQGRVQKAVDLGETILKQIIEAVEKTGRIPVDLFEWSKEYVIQCNEVRPQLEADRKPGTQAFDLIRKMFTAIEAKIDPTNGESIAYQLQKYNNKYVQDKADDERKAREEADRLARKGAEVASIRASISGQIEQSMIAYITRVKNNMVANFNSITLDNFDEKSEALQALDCKLPIPNGEGAEEKFYSSLIKITWPSAIYHNQDEINIIANDEWSKFNRAFFHQRFFTDITNHKTDLVASLPAKKIELQAIADAKNKKERERLEREQREREAEAQRKLDQAAEKEKQDAIDKAESKKAEGTMQSLFDAQQTISAQVVETKTATKTSVKIIVNNHAGLVEIFTLWYSLYSIKYTVEEILGKKVQSMITDLEREANKAGGGKRIAGSNVTYKVETTSVNRKATQS